METLKEKTAKGLFWGALNGGTMQLLNVIFGIVLARILSPADYAIVGVLAIFSTIADNLQTTQAWHLVAQMPLVRGAAPKTPKARIASQIETHFL